MKGWFTGGRLLAAALMMATTATAGASALPPVAVAATVWGTPYGVRVEAEEAGVRVRGNVRAAAINPGRRLTGRVRVEVVDGAGAVLAVDHGEVRRKTSARHTNRGRFEVNLGALPARAAALRVVYRGP